MTSPTAPRASTIERVTTETRVKATVDLDGTGAAAIGTGVGFFDHMLEQLAKHSLIDMEIAADGDTHIDDHHTVEDVGIALGQAIAEALGERRGIRRYGDAVLPMDEAMTGAAVDVSGRPFLVWDVPFNAERIGAFDTQLVREFFQALAVNARITLHVRGHYGANAHHVAESCFKGVARALRMAVEPDPRAGDAVPSTKGTIA